MGGGLQNIDRWETLTAPITSCPSWRKLQTLDIVAQYVAVMKQFDVVNNPRYKRFQNEQGVWQTCCNIFVWDVTKAMGVEIPHWYGKELNANNLIKWLNSDGVVDHGWKKIGSLESVDIAVEMVNRGQPVVATWYNPNGIGHVAMVVPNSSGQLRIAQAGANNYFDVPLINGFGSAAPIIFYYHE